MLDIHTHILPFVDDGSDSYEDSIRMVREEIEFGMDGAILTPHYSFKKYLSSVEKVQDSFEGFKSKLKEEGIEFNLYLGQEITYKNNYKEIISMLNEGKLLTLKGSKYILLEFDVINRVDDLSEIVYNFRRGGYKVVIAHIERYVNWIRFSDILNLVNEGALIQINSSSLIDKNKDVKKLAKKILKKRLVNFIASDVHSFRDNTLQKTLPKYKKYINYVEL